jgi:hypothetical protein
MLKYFRDHAQMHARTGSFPVADPIWHKLITDLFNDVISTSTLFHFATTFRQAVGPTKPPIQWVTVALSPGVKRPKREASPSPPPYVEVRNTWRYTSTPPIRLQGVVLS